MSRIREWYHLKSKFQYNIGFIRKEISPINSYKSYRRINWVKSSNFDKSGWYADPFILDVTDERIIVLAEKLDYKSNLGKIVWLDIAIETYSIIEETVILDLDTHLSFPYIIREEKNIYVMPENNQSGKLFIYDLDLVKKKMVNPKILIDVPLIDAQIFKYNCRYYLLGCRYSTDFSSTREVEIYESEDLFGEYKLKQILKSDRKIERGAGSIFFDEANQIIRPCQKCQNGYGESVIFNKLSLNSMQIFEEEIIGEMKPHLFSRNPLQLHTYNSYKGYQIIDGYGSGNRFLHCFFNIISSFRKILKNNYKLVILCQYLKTRYF